MKNKLCIVVVLYNQQIYESSSCRSIFAFINQLTDFDVTIYVRNNGPKAINSDFIKTSQNVKYYFTESLNNVSLSSIYNDAINLGDFEYILILDQDSIMTDSYFNAVKFSINNGVDILLPMILVKDLQKYPKNGKHLVDKGFIVGKRNISSISSGLMFSKKLIVMFRDKYGEVFDRNFIFYGVDSSFFLRLRKLKQNLIMKCDGDLIHSLSSSEVEEDNITKFRIYERTCDLALQTRYYPRISILYFVSCFFYKCIFEYRSGHLINLFFKVLLTGKHPRILQ